VVIEVDFLTPTRVRELAGRFGFKPSKTLGQNFVVDANTVRRIVRLAEVGAGDRVVEVGAGMGTLTLGLAAVAEQVVAIELDRALIPILEEVTGPLGNVEIVHADALEVDYEALCGAAPHRFVSNLPYNIATPLIARILETAECISDLVVTMQAEVGRRLVAGPGSKEYGSLSVLVAYHCASRVAGRVPRKVFWPEPKVDSVVVRMQRRPPPVDVDFTKLMTIVHAAFAQRRKMVRNSIASVLGLPPDEVVGNLEAAGVSPAARAEMLGIEDYARLVETFDL
jgi:16S rRNA (adenine1518-N6/adenine1519-N6)-dimethyltransferase